MAEMEVLLGSEFQEVMIIKCKRKVVQVERWLMQIVLKPVVVFWEWVIIITNMQNPMLSLEEQKLTTEMQVDLGGKEVQILVPRLVNVMPQEERVVLLAVLAIIIITADKKMV